MFRSLLYCCVMALSVEVFAGTIIEYENGGSFTTAGALAYSDGTTDLKVSGDTLLRLNNTAFVGTDIPINLDNFRAAGFCTPTGTLVGDGVTGSLYFSFLCENVGNNTSRTSGLILGDSSRTAYGGTNQTYIGRAGSTNITYSLNRSASTDPTTGLIGTAAPFGTNVTHLIVGKIDFQEGTQKAVLSLWRDPDLTAGMSGQDTDKSTLNIATTNENNILKLSFDKIRFIAPNADNIMVYDEVRFGTTWESVLPTKYVAWDGASGTNDWDTAGNWNRGTMPENGDFVTAGGGRKLRKIPL